MERTIGNRDWLNMPGWPINIWAKERAILEKEEERWDINIFRASGQKRETRQRTKWHNKILDGENPVFSTDGGPTLPI